MANSYDIINTAMRGGLPSLLAEWKAEGLSLDQMSRALYNEGFDVSRETVRRWFLHPTEVSA